MDGIRVKNVQQISERGLWRKPLWGQEFAWGSLWKVTVAQSTLQFCRQGFCSGSLPWFIGTLPQSPLGTSFLVKEEF